jgi:hypothetical protein
VPHYATDDEKVKVLLFLFVVLSQIVFEWIKQSILRIATMRKDRRHVKVGIVFQNCSQNKMWGCFPII